MYYITFSFDDGFEKSTIKNAEIFESFGLRTEFTVFCFPYNSSNKQLEEWISTKVRAFRTGYNMVINPIPSKETKMIYGDCWPDTENQIKNTLTSFLNQKSGWYIYTAHGLDGEGWEPMTADFLKRTLDQLLKRDDTKNLPAQLILKENE